VAAGADAAAPAAAAVPRVAGVGREGVRAGAVDAEVKGARAVPVADSDLAVVAVRVAKAAALPRVAVAEEAVVVVPEERAGVELPVAAEVAVRPEVVVEPAAAGEEDFR